MLYHEKSKLDQSQQEDEQSWIGDKLKLIGHLSPKKLVDTTSWSRDGVVFYHVVIMSGEEPNQLVTHVLVNAIDGNVMKSEQELPRKMRRTEQP